MANRETGIFFRFSGGHTATASCVATRIRCTNYHATTDALIQTVSTSQASDEDCRQGVFTSDALTGLQAYQNNRLLSLSRAVHQVARTRRTALQWISAHCGVHCRVSGNERADALTRKGAEKEQPNSISYSEKKSITRALSTIKPCRDDYHLLSREQQSVLVRLHTGHNRLSDHMYRKLKLVLSPICPFGQEDPTREHTLQRCPPRQAAGRKCVSS